MVATNNYLRRWKDTATGLETFAFKHAESITIHLFTNQVREATEWGKKSLRRIKLEVHEVEGWGWPEATLFRYDFILQNEKSFKEDIIMYCDSDMLVLGEFEDLLNPESWKSGLAFVQHPGFFRNDRLKGFLDFCRNPKLLIPKFRSFLVGAPGIGSWEGAKWSSAYVAPAARRNYVHGAIWFGEKGSVIEMCKVLSRNIHKDLELNYIATWHDESHLNWYHSKFFGTVLSCELSGVLKYKHLKRLQPRLVTVEKSKSEGREPTHFGERND